MTYIKNILVLLMVFATINSFSQSKGKFQKDFLNAKDLLEKQEYLFAYDHFLELTKDQHPNNTFQYQSGYYAALCALHNGKLIDGAFLLSKARESYPNQILEDEILFLQADIAFSRGMLQEGYHFTEIIKDKKIKKEARSMVIEYALHTKFLNQLIDLQCINDEDKNLAEVLAYRLDHFDNTFSEKEILEYLIQSYQLDRKKYIRGTFKKSTKKPVYNVAVILPFEAQNKKKLLKNARYFEMYEGIKMAVDTLQKKGIKIKLFVYDNQKDSAVTDSLMRLPEMYKMDLFIGPIFRNTSEIVAQFAKNHEINYVNPLFSNADLVEGNEYAFLMSPSYIQTGNELGRFSAEHFVDKDVLIFYGTDVRDSVTAYEYRHVLDSNYTHKINFFKIDNENVNDIRKILATERSSDLSHIFIASDQDLLAANLITGLDHENIHVPIIAPEHWLDIQLITYDQFLRRHFYFYSSSYVNVDDSLSIQPFRKAFEANMNIKPTTYNDAYIGYDLMLYFGNILYKHGNLFNHAILGEPYTYGKIIKGLYFNEGNTNNVIPLYRFTDNYTFEWVNNPARLKKEYAKNNK